MGSIICLNVYANPNCVEQVNFYSSFKKIENYLTIDIKRKDNKSFTHYAPNLGNDSSNYGVILLESSIEKTEVEGYGNGGFKGPEEYIQRYEKFNFIGEDFWNYSKKGLSSGVMRARESQVYKLPLKQAIEYQRYTKTINLNYFLYYYQDLLILNNIKGPQKIKFYITFLHNQETGACSYYETKPFIYNFDIIDYKLTNFDGENIDYIIDKTKHYPVLKEKTFLDKLRGYYEK